MATSITVNGKTHNVEAAADRSGDCGRDRHATGTRLRDLTFTRDKVKTALA